MMKLDSVSKTYTVGETRVQALRSMNLEISSGDFVSVTGPSGSGKSTLMNIMGLLDVPTEGQVALNGMSTDTLSENSLSKIRGELIGFVFQTFNLIPRITALQNVMLPMTFVSKITKSERRHRAEKLLGELGLTPRVHHKPNELSGGERQRVSIARALANDPILVLADEPTGNLDSETGRSIMEVFSALNREGRTLVVVTHNPDVAAFSRRRIALRDGSIVGG